MPARHPRPKRAIPPPLRNLLKLLQVRFPAISAALDEALDLERGTSHLDLVLGDQRISVAWSPRRGLGISSRADSTYGEAPDEVYGTVAAAAQRIERLLLSHTHTSPPAPADLAEVRQRLGFSQVALAKRMKVQQASISKLERRSDARLSTLTDYLGAMGAGMQLIVRTKFGTFPLRPLGASKKPRVKGRR